MDMLKDLILNLFEKYNINVCMFALIVSIGINIFYYPLIKNKKVFKKLPTWKRSIVIQSYLITLLLILFLILGICG